MSRTAAARQPKQRVGAAFAPWLMLLLATVGALPAGARAEAPTALLFVGEPTEPASRWATRLRDRGILRAEPVLDVERWAASLPAMLPRERLAPLEAIERLLRQAEAEAASLREDHALANLAQAAAEAEQLGDVPGAAAWNAEVQLRLGAVAAQAGLPALADVALARAASLDPARALEAAEAPPDVVSRAEQIRAHVAAAPEATLPIDAAADGARVFVDDVDRGALPLSLHLRAGVHVVRIEAPGHLAWGALIEVLEGRRPPLRVVLAPDPARATVRQLAERARRGDVEGVAGALATLRAQGAPLRVLLVEPARSTLRALIARCDPAGCRGPLRFSPASFDPGALRALERPLSRARLAAGRVWLARSQRRAPRGELGEHWYVWPLLAGLAVGAATTVLLISTESEEPPRRRIVIDPAGIAE